MSSQAKNRPGGVLQISAAATRKPTTSQKASQRVPAPKLRLIIRRLPPGLSEAELWDALGIEWKAGQGNVDWFAFKQGEVSKDPSKPSRPGRAYLKVKDQLLLEKLSTRVRNSQFKDSKNTSSDPCLIGPPSLEFAPYPKTPGGRIRNDGRQGTIDQDPEFIDFLQSLTEPIVKSVINGSDNAESKQDKVTTTPLVQFIKEKKANKAKEKEAASVAKSSKKTQDGKESKSKRESRSTVVVKSNSSTAEKSRVAKPVQDTVKATNKPAATTQSKSAATKTDAKAKDSVPANTATPKKERERGNASAAARMISRDLGLLPKEPRTARLNKTTNTQAPGTGLKAETGVSSTNTLQDATPTTKPKVASIPAAVSTTTIATAPVAVTPTAPSGPRGGRTNQAQQSKQPQPASQKQAKSIPQPSAGAKSAFLKHANPSQGITEDLLKIAFGEFGEITRCQIDKKKGLGYVDFSEPEALKKAMAVSPVKVGNGQVVVLENRSPYRKNAQQKSEDKSTAGQAQTSPLKSPSAAMSSPSKPPVLTSPVLASIVPAQDQPVNSPPLTALAKGTEPKDTTQQTATTPAQPPTAPKNPRGAPASGRGGRGSFANRGSGRGPFRGRGGRGSRGGNAQNAAPSATVVTAPPNTTEAEHGIHKPD